MKVRSVHAEGRLEISEGRRRQGDVWGVVFGTLRSVVTNHDPSKAQRLARVDRYMNAAAVHQCKKDEEVVPNADV